MGFPRPETSFTPDELTPEQMAKCMLLGIGVTYHKARKKWWVHSRNGLVRLIADPGTPVWWETADEAITAVTQMPKNGYNWN